MIVERPPYDLVIVFADADTQRFVERLVERGQERRCLAPLSWRSHRDTRRDSLIANPGRVTEPFRGLCPKPRLMVLWDHVGSGRESESPSAVEAHVTTALIASGWPIADLAAIAIAPELEVLLEPTWDRVKKALADRRQRPLPTDSEVSQAARAKLGIGRNRPLLSDDAKREMLAHPKEILEGLVEHLQLRRTPHLYAELGNELSIPVLKGGGAQPACSPPPTATNAAARIASYLVRWFPGGDDVNIQS